MIVPTESTSQSVDVQVVDDSGLPITGLIAGTFPTVKYSLAGANADVTVSLSNLSALTDPWASGGLKERGGGYYRLDLPDAAFATAGVVTPRAEASGQHLLCPRLEVGTFGATADVAATGGVKLVADLNGNVAGAVAGVGPNGIAAVSIAANAFTAAKFAADVGTEFAAAVFAYLIETGITFAQLCEAIGAAIAGQVSVNGSSYDAIGNPGTTRIVADSSDSGNRTVTLTL